MTLDDIYDQFSHGSKGFCNAVSTHCGFDLSRSEIERIGDKANNAQEFEDIYENEDWWRDSNEACGSMDST